MANLLQTTSLTVRKGEVTSGDTDLSNMRIVALHVAALPDGPVTLRFAARARDRDEQQNRIDFQPVGGDVALGLHLNVPGYYPAPEWLSCLRHCRVGVLSRTGEAFPMDDDFVVWLICEVRR